MSKLAVVGKDYQKTDAFDKITGAAKFCSDMTVPRMLHAKVLRSPYPHAIVTKIDASDALKLPGVKAVLTHDDVPKILYNRDYHTVWDTLERDNYILEKKARYVGDKIAAVAAEDLDTAEEALDLIDVRYQELPAVYDPVEAMQADAPKIHDEIMIGDRRVPVRNNVIRNTSLEVGDLEKGFSEADMVFEDRYATQRAQQVASEPHSVLVIPEANGRLTVWAGTQSIFGLRMKLAAALGMPESMIKCVRTHMGGSFGSYLDMNIYEPITALLAMKTRRPVKYVNTREEEFISTARHPAVSYIKTGVKRDGTLTARYLKTMMDGAAYAAHSAAASYCVGGWFLSMYKAPNMKYEGCVVYTNTFPCGAFRGFGHPQQNFPVESQMDMIAEELGIDPVEIRLKNHVGLGDDFYYQGVARHGPVCSCGVPELLEKGAKLIGWQEKRLRKREISPTKRYGIGVARGFHTSGAGDKRYGGDTYEYASSIVKFNEDGAANVITAGADTGCGEWQVWCQIAAETLEIPFEKVIMSSMSGITTDEAPHDLGTHATRGTYAIGMGVKAAAEDAKKRILEVAAGILEGKAEDLEAKDGKVYPKKSPDRGLTYAEIAREAINLGYGPIIGTSAIRPSSAPPAFGVKFVELEVDLDTGKVNLLNVVAGHDCGRVVYPAGAECQLGGGVQQGLGFALTEDLVIDEETGATVNGNLRDYKILRTTDMPPVQLFFVEALEPTGPFGAKGIGEAPINDMASAVANAIYHATGMRFKELPITPERILRALGRI